MNFSSDTAAPAHPAIIEAIAAANTGAASSYGADKWMAAAKAALSDVFETDLDMWLVPSGTAANALALSLLCPSHGAILCHAEAHIERDERGAPEFYTGGAKLSLLPGRYAKIDLDALKRRLDANRPGFVHEVPACALSLSNLTECGAAYSAAETAERAELMHPHGPVHLDGARFANTLVSTAKSPADLSWRAGVNVMSFGATKNGAIGCEAILLFGEARKLAPDLMARAKRAGHMPPKMRFLAAQMGAYLKDGLWLDLARRANSSAKKLADVLTTAGGKLVYPLDGNEVFIDIEPAVVKKLNDAGAAFYPWAGKTHRFVCSWNTSEADISGIATVLSPS
ncbi:MAG: beta-eliminating lyase-related protein [Hyphomonadaceae bacterium]|nr:beta-eliminating lyase-related protein [Hyphomonadaceae bacterium]